MIENQKNIPVIILEQAVIYDSEKVTVNLKRSSSFMDTVLNRFRWSITHLDNNDSIYNATISYINLPENDNECLKLNCTKFRVIFMLKNVSDTIIKSINLKKIVTSFVTDEGTESIPKELCGPVENSMIHGLILPQQSIQLFLYIETNNSYLIDTINKEGGMIELSFEINSFYLSNYEIIKTNFCNGKLISSDYSF